MRGDAWTTVLGLLFLCLVESCGVFVAASQPDSQGCDTVRAMNGWRECRLIERKYVFLGLRGCDAKDGHAYDVAGENTFGQPAAAVVCCGTFFKGCTVRAR